ncbi:HK97 gp10 family phage protein [Faecalispora jeddahensis]|uniref:HK97 gp10 family phage protein n=1 Tax=Faecalispora jeddahensis TaxID=1414721 RepID=UPI00189778FD|nr:HK97 gp10 family phage protein [Faecalispora jeddahensis]MDU6348338.1 HK97 gp10 family phage protein [Clostridium sp.]
MITQDYKQFRAALEKLGADLDDSARRVVDGMANVGLNVTKKNTPVGGYQIYTDSKGGKRLRRVKGAPIGGTLRRGWKKTKAFKLGRDWQSGYTNNTEYGIYVNNGHRVVGKYGATVGYVKGERMLEQGIDAARRQSESLFRQEIARVKQKGGW